ncbi:MAG TPA: GNAT family N-acetyltransferase [Solirubrobacteraceae bacterium]|jgi:predicted GNAT family N-acyltransferase
MAAEDIDVRWAEHEGDLGGALALREEVFCHEQGVPREEEIDGRDGDALHVVAVELGDGRVVGTVRLLIDAGTAKVGRVAVASPWRRRGIASRMLDMALDGARENGCNAARLAAQLQASELYARAGFAVESDVFEEAGMPHVWMGMRLNAEQ